MSTQTAYEETLDALAAVLRASPMTAREIAAHMQCCRPAVYQRVRALKSRGVVVSRRREPRRVGKPGPRAVIYSVC